MSIRDRRFDPDASPKSLWGSLTEGWRDLVDAFGSIPSLSLRTVEFMPGASLAFAVPALTRPRGVVLVSLYRLDTGETSPVTFAWSFANQTVSTTSFSALAATKWRATFLVIGGA